MSLSYKTIGPMLTALILGGAVAGCGTSGMDRARAMSQGEIAQESDEFVCKRLRSFAYIGRVPDAWLDESQRRNLDSCIEQGVKQRRAEGSRTGTQKCDRFAVIRIDRCP